MRTRSAMANTSGRVGVEHDLQQSLAITQVDEDHPAVVAAAMRPAGHGDHLTGQGLVDLTAIMGAHKLLKPKGKARDAKAWARAGKPAPSRPQRRRVALGTARLTGLFAADLPRRARFA